MKLIKPYSYQPWLDADVKSLIEKIALYHEATKALGNANLLAHYTQWYGDYTVTIEYTPDPEENYPDVDV